MKSSLALLVLVLLLLYMLAGCAPGVNQFKGTTNDQNVVAGFWLGLWQGFIAPIMFVVSLFRHNLSIYEVEFWAQGTLPITRLIETYDL